MTLAGCLLFSLIIFSEGIRKENSIDLIKVVSTQRLFDHSLIQ